MNDPGADVREGDPRRGDPKPGVLRRLGRIIASGLVVVYLLVDQLLTAVLLPLISALSRLPVFAAIGRLIGRLPPYGVLVLLAVPFVLIEPAKVFALFWIASGHFVQGPVLLVLSYVLSILSCDRIYHAGHAKLMQIDWFARVMGWIGDLRRRGIEWVKATRAWIAARTLVETVRMRISAWVAGARS